MGWNLCIATECERERAKLMQSHEASDDENEDLFYEGFTSLSRQFSYGLLRDDGEFYKDLTKDELEALEPDDIECPERWQARNPQRLLEILCAVRERLERENEQMPVAHFLWYIDETGRRWNGSTQITLPFGGIELKVPHNPIVKLDGGHNNPDRRWDLCQYDVRVDANLLAQYNRELQDYCTKYAAELGIDPLNTAFSICGGSFSQIEPLVEEPVGWIPVQSVLDVLGYRVEVESEDALATFQPDLKAAIECCEQAILTGTPIYWLME
ncbi:MAG: hypothetical protein KME17_22860 [Cyanosarcina radialis HA8281-LM2]|jgi:hypothetical protein|nr:hypothetical protein [Cyanosarcina radialis HA8281-LM2]